MGIVSSDLAFVVDKVPLGRSVLVAAVWTKAWVDRP
jgi:hypothetical protein